MTARTAPPDGTALYAARCSSCHDHAVDWIPPKVYISTRRGADEIIDQGTCDAATRVGETAGEHMQRFRKHLRDLRDYLVNNQTSLTNYAHAYRNGLRISSAPAESGMSHVINQRMGKRQPMCWTAEGAHLLLQVRCAVLDGRLDALFRERYPRFRLTSPTLELPGL